MENGQEVWICNYNNSHTPLPPTPPEPNETTDLRTIISGNINLRNSHKRTYTVDFIDKNGNAINCKDVDFKWNVTADFDVAQNVYENKIDLFVDNVNLIDSSFSLQIILFNSVAAELKINIIN